VSPAISKITFGKKANQVRWGQLFSTKAPLTEKHHINLHSDGKNLSELYHNPDMAATRFSTRLNLEIIRNSPFRQQLDVDDLDRMQTPQH
jgi:hypothetical protein